MNSKINELGSKQVDDVSLWPIQKIISRPNGPQNCWINIYESIYIEMIIWEIKFYYNYNNLNYYF